MAWASSSGGPLSRDDGEDDLHLSGPEQATVSGLYGERRARTREQHEAALQETLSTLRSWRTDLHEEEISTLTMTTETRWRQSLDSGGWPMSTDDGEPEYAERVLPPESDEAAGFAWLECGLPPLPSRYQNAPRFEWVPGGFDCRARTPQALIEMFRKVRTVATSLPCLRLWRRTRAPAPGLPSYPMTAAPGSTRWKTRRPRTPARATRRES